MSLPPVSDLSWLDVYAAQAFPPGTPTDRRTFYSPVDQVPKVLQVVVATAQRSLVVAMYGFDDERLAMLIKKKLENAAVYVQLSLDSSQAGGVHEKVILADESYPASTIAIGRSEKGAIMHLKEVVIDGTILVTGSTNWSTGGETLQDNQLTVEYNPWACAVATARIGAIHADMINKAHALPREAPVVVREPFFRRLTAFTRRQG